MAHRPALLFGILKAGARSNGALLRRIDEAHEELAVAQKLWVFGYLDHDIREPLLCAESARLVEALRAVADQVLVRQKVLPYRDHERAVRNEAQEARIHKARVFRIEIFRLAIYPLIP